LVLPFWYRPSRVVLEKGPLNGCVCVCAGSIFCALVLKKPIHAPKFGVLGDLIP